MATRPDADLVPIGLGVTQGGDDVVGVDRVNDDVRVALGHALIPDGTAAGRFVAVVAPEEMPSGR